MFDDDGNYWPTEQDWEDFRRDQEAIDLARAEEISHHIEEETPPW